MKEHREDMSELGTPTGELFVEVWSIDRNSVTLLTNFGYRVLSKNDTLRVTVPVVSATVPVEGRLTGGEPETPEETYLLRGIVKSLRSIDESLKQGNAQGRAVLSELHDRLNDINGTVRQGMFALSSMFGRRK